MRVFIIILFDKRYQFRITLLAGRMSLFFVMELTRRRILRVSEYCLHAPLTIPSTTILPHCSPDYLLLHCTHSHISLHPPRHTNHTVTDDKMEACPLKRMSSILPPASTRYLSVRTLEPCHTLAPAKPLHSGCVTRPSPDLCTPSILPCWEREHHVTSPHPYPLSHPSYFLNGNRIPIQEQARTSSMLFLVLIFLLRVSAPRQNQGPIYSHLQRRGDRVC